MDKEVRKSEIVYLRPYDWKTEDPDNRDEDSHLFIHIWCLNEKSEPCLVRINDFDAFCYIELPSFANGTIFNWNDQSCFMYFEWLCNALGSDRPKSYQFVIRDKLYYHRTRNYPMLIVSFTTLSALDHCERFLNRAHRIPHLGLIMVRVWETDISTIRKTLTIRGITYSEGLKIEVQEIPDIDRITYSGKEYIGKWQTMEFADVKVNPKIFSFDIEVYSDNHRKFPEQYSAKHVVTMISCITQTLGNKDSRKKTLLNICKSNDIKGAEVINLKSEVEMIDKLNDVIIKEDPIIMTGYNIFDFDLPYLDFRLKRRLREWKPMGRIINRIPKFRSSNWSSSAYGRNDISYLDHVDGRIFIDLYPIIKREHKLVKYTLDFVSKFFLGRGKHPISARRMFEIYEIQDEALRSAETAKVGEYCLEDATLVIDLFEKLNIWPMLNEFSAVLGVSIFDLYTRGQQHRVMNQLYNEAFSSNVVLDKRESDITEFTGGFVGDPSAGLYRNIMILDFASLYPSIIQAFNICYRTLIAPEDYERIPKEKCHILTFKEDGENNNSDTDSDDTDDEDENKRRPSKRSHKDAIREIRFIKEPEGLLPRMCRKLVAKRNVIKAKIKEEEEKKENKDNFILTMLKLRSTAIKISANSIFGFTGVPNGKRSLIEAAMFITGKGRWLIHKVNEIVEKKYHSKVIYNDTDSCMIYDPSLQTGPGIFTAMKKMAKEISNEFPSPLSLEPECVAGVFFCVKKKKYAYMKLNQMGELITNSDDVVVKGLLSARRDNTNFARATYVNVLTKILLGTPMKEVATVMEEACFNIMTRGVSYRDLSVVQTMGVNYKSASYPMKIFGDEMRKIGRPIAPGERVDYLIVIPESGRRVLKGYRMRTPELYLENCYKEPLDLPHYVEKSLMNSLEQLFSIAYQKELEVIEKKAGPRFRNRLYTRLSSNHIKTMLKLISIKECIINDIKNRRWRLRSIRPRIVIIEEKKKPNIIIKEDIKIDIRTPSIPPIVIPNVSSNRSIPKIVPIQVEQKINRGVRIVVI